MAPAAGGVAGLTGMASVSPDGMLLNTKDAGNVATAIPAMSVMNGGHALNSVGLPLRPQQPECMLYRCHRMCAAGQLCQFHHPEPSTLPPSHADEITSFAQGVASRKRAMEEANQDDAAKLQKTDMTLPVTASDWAVRQEEFFGDQAPLTAGWIRALSKHSGEMYFIRTADMYSTFKEEEVK
eukprot:gnl/TRDRNA2_/TRDRNA2_168558_c1_seq2.p1 gnl/TRDRNA2_/TRDRNA2_168558_c1~~gnl/TRDRNA2_/TRDRNA2_168558_c1_seq2.p1  ORF type:complete len:210 (-),score=44.18 gnl/TRDRNA2_/TRDRNA2_168558_c1_seq2:49-594(-)